MKKTELVVGKEYYCDNSINWQKYGYCSIRYILRDANAPVDGMHTAKGNGKPNYLMAPR
jgi:hypothetical protein